MNDTDAAARLADMLERCGIERGVLGRIDADNVARILLPIVREIADQRAAEAVQQFEELFSGGPDTSCRTTWRRTPGQDTAVECVEVPMDDLRDAFDRAAARGEAGR